MQLHMDEVQIMCIIYLRHLNGLGKIAMGFFWGVGWEELFITASDYTVVGEPLVKRILLYLWMGEVGSVFL